MRAIHRRAAAATLMAGVLVSLWGGVAGAAPIGNPVSDFKSGEAFFQAGVSNGTRSMTSEGLGDADFTVNRLNLAVGFAVNERSVLGFTGGTLSVTPNYRGAQTATGYELGLFYRQVVGTREGFRHGFSLQYRHGEAFSDFADVYLGEFFLAYGFAAQSGSLTFYGGPLYSSVSATIVAQPGGHSYSADSVSNFGIFGGVEIKVTPTFVLGLEAQAITESGIAAYGQVRF